MLSKDLAPQMWNVQRKNEFHSFYTYCSLFYPSACWTENKLALGAELLWEIKCVTLSHNSDDLKGNKSSRVLENHIFI